MGRASLLRVVRHAGLLTAAAVAAACERQAATADGAPRVIQSATSPDGIPIVYEVHGSGAPALVFVHGWSCDRTYWSSQIEPFSKAYQVVSIDLAGHGESGLGGREQWTMSAFGTDVAAVVDQLGLDRVILIGHSMGGDVIVEAARRLAGRVAGLVWVDTYKQLDTPRTAEQLETLTAPFRRDFKTSTLAFVRGMFPPNADSALVERVAKDMSSAPPDVALSAMLSAMSFDRAIPAALQELKLPVVAINPDNPPTDMESMQRNGVEVVLMPGVGHFLHMENPEGFNERLMQVVQKLAR